MLGIWAIAVPVVRIVYSGLVTPVYRFELFRTKYMVHACVRAFARARRAHVRARAQRAWTLPVAVVLEALWVWLMAASVPVAALGGAPTLFYTGRVLGALLLLVLSLLRTMHALSAPFTSARLNYYTAFLCVVQLYLALANCIGFAAAFNFTSSVVVLAIAPVSGLLAIVVVFLVQSRTIPCVQCARPVANPRCPHQLCGACCRTGCLVHPSLPSRTIDWVAHGDRQTAIVRRAYLLFLGSCPLADRSAVPARPIDYDASALTAQVQALSDAAASPTVAAPPQLRRLLSSKSLASTGSPGGRTYAGAGIGDAIAVNTEGAVVSNRTVAALADVGLATSTGGVPGDVSRASGSVALSLRRTLTSIMSTPGIELVQPGSPRRAARRRGGAGTPGSPASPAAAAAAAAADDSGPRLARFRSMHEVGAGQV